MGHRTPPTFFGVASVPDKLLGVVGKEVADDVSNELPVKSVVSSWNRGVGGEQGALRQFIPIPSLLEHLKHGEGAVAFVEMHSNKIVAERLKRSNTAHAQEVFLPHARAVITTVQACAQADEF